MNGDAKTVFLGSQCMSVILVELRVRARHAKLTKLSSRESVLLFQNGILI
jgi:hypothetical protein